MLLKIGQYLCNYINFAILFGGGGGGGGGNMSSWGGNIPWSPPPDKTLNTGGSLCSWYYTCRCTIVGHLTYPTGLYLYGSIKARSTKFLGSSYCSIHQNLFLKHVLDGVCVLFIVHIYMLVYVLMCRSFYIYF